MASSALWRQQSPSHACDSVRLVTGVEVRKGLHERAQVAMYPRRVVRPGDGTLASAGLASGQEMLVLEPAGGAAI